ncbi:MAG: hypothetical protein Q8P75_02435 [bacterium]|nr:hypothetical protein [bacterium]
MRFSILHSKFSILLRKAGLIAILAVLVLGIIPIQTTAQNIIVQPPPTSPFAQGGVLYQPKQITFNIKTDGTIYRAVKGKKINISTEVSLVSPEELKAGDKIDRPKNDTIQGFYVASVGQGATDICGAYNPFVGGVIGYIIWGGCHFEAVAKPSATELPFKQTLELDTSESQYPIGKRKIWVFPVLDLSGTVGATDEPYTNAPVTATLEIYGSQAELDAAAKAAGDANPYVSGSAGNSTTSATGGKGIADTFTGTLISVLNIIIGAIVTIVGSIIKYLGAIIIVPILEATLSMDASQFAGGPILAGWTFVRDAVNMFFILFLIIIGFATILKLENYSYKKLLVNLVVMALLVNFSLVIARIILQVSDAAQFSFLPVSTVVEGGEGMTGVRYLYQKLSVEHLSKIVDGFRVFSTSTSGALAGTMTILFEFILQLAVVITFGAMAAFMLIRTVMIYVLLVLSPLAFALLVVPATVSYGKQWWSTYTKYVLFGPIFAFFLRLDFEIYTKGMKLLPTLFDKTITNPDTVDYLNLLKNQNGGVTFAQMLQLGTIFVLILAFKWVELLVAKSMGIAGAGAIVGLAERGLKAPFAWGGKGVGALAGLGARAYTKRLTQALGAAKEKGQKGRAGLYQVMEFLNPRVAKEAWKKRKEEKEREAYEGAIGYSHDTLNRMMPTEWKWKMGLPELGQKTMYGRMAESRLIAEKAKYYDESGLSANEKARAFSNARHAEDVLGVMRAAILGRNENDIVLYEKQKRYDEELEKRVKQKTGAGVGEPIAREQARQELEKDENFAVTYEPGEERTMARKKLEEVGWTPEQIGRQFARLDDFAEASRNARSIGGAVEEWDGNFRAADDFSGYEKLAREKGTGAMLQGLADTGVFKPSYRTEIRDGREYKILESVDFEGNTIANVDQFKNTVKSTKKLESELYSARRTGAAKFRMDRGSASNWIGSGIEPAAFMRMDAKGNVLGISKASEKLYSSLGPAYVDTVHRVRDFQARALRMFGINKGDAELTPENINFDVMAETFRANKALTTELLDKKASLSPAMKARIIEEMAKRGISDIKLTMEEEEKGGASPAPSEL